jgi:hypothetical protein
MIIYKMNQFNMNTMCKNPQFYICNNEDVSAPVLIADICNKQNYKDYPTQIIIASNETSNNLYSKYFPYATIYNELEFNVIEELLSEQTKPRSRKALIILDNCFSTVNKVFHNQHLTNLMLNGRHYNITSFTVQLQPLGLIPELRTNFDYICLLKNHSHINKKIMYEKFCSFIVKFTDFVTIYDNITNDGDILIVNQKSKQMETKLYYYNY